MNRQKLLITGASGFLGWNLCHEAKKDREIIGTVLTNPVDIKRVTIVKIDLTEYKALKELFHEVRPDGVIHTAAATSPNYCQEHPVEAEKANIDVPVNIAGLCADRGIPYVFTSSDLVFSGLNAPYKEGDPVSPVNIYGEQKALAEEKVLKAYPKAAVCRMPLMFGAASPAHGTFFQQMVSALRDGSELRLFTDEYRTPASAVSASRGLLLALDKANGLLHLGGSERISRFNFGLLLMDAMGVTEANIIRCRQEDMKMSAPRAPDLSMDSSKAFALGYRPLQLKEELTEILKGEMY